MAWGKSGKMKFHLANSEGLASCNSYAVQLGLEASAFKEQERLKPETLCTACKKKFHQGERT